MFIPGILITILTFPGVIIHELGHKIFCNLMGVPVLQVKYFRFGNPAGYVIHEPAKKFSQTFMITVGPFIVNTLLSFLTFVIAVLSGGNYLFLWLGASIGMHSFPSTGDAKSLWSESKRHLKHSAFALIGFPFAILIFIGSILSIFWFDLIYAAMLYFLASALFV